MSEAEKRDSATAGAVPIAPVQAAPAEYEMAKMLSIALGMLELIAAQMPADAGLRNTIEAECAAMRSAALAILRESLAQAKAAGI